jgi:hypothetical protein
MVIIDRRKKRSELESWHKPTMIFFSLLIVRKEKKGLKQRQTRDIFFCSAFLPNDINIHFIMSEKSSVSSGLQKAFDKYSKFGKTQAQLSDHNGLRIGSAGIQKMMKDCSLIDTKYTSQLLDNDIARVLGKLTINSNEMNSVHYPKGT